MVSSCSILLTDFRKVFRCAWQALLAFLEKINEGIEKHNIIKI